MNKNILQTLFFLYLYCILIFFNNLYNKTINQILLILILFHAITKFGLIVIEKKILNYFLRLIVFYLKANYFL